MMVQRLPHNGVSVVVKVLPKLRCSRLLPDAPVLADRMRPL
jgi:hypothetical protein